ncbi:LysR family transcriptional regulator [Desertivirga arenae]|uniref:LysR family transcriptional regulator n=1 Tax=Desertivirga arenae TaxID=2810309 RepID=UPI001A960294|nr:LysR family transcriptional regulator [Pedobacter sp. SYSU D00823]
MIFDFRLKVFHTVATKLSFTKAALELFITQPAVTKHIRELEQQTGQRLFKRNGNSVSLTAAGELLLRYAEKVFDIYSALDTELAQLNNTIGGTLRIGASTTIAQAVLPKLLALFKKSYPAVSFTFTEANTDAISHKIIDEKLDIGLVEGSSHFPQLAYSNFIKDEIVLVARSGSQLAKLTEIVPRQLLDIPLIKREQGSGTLEVINNALLAIGLNPRDLNVEARIENSASIKEYLLHSDAAAFLSVQAITKELRYNELTIIDVKGLEISRDFQFVHSQGNVSSLVHLFKRFCATHYNLK